MYAVLTRGAYRSRAFGQPIRSLASQAPPPKPPSAPKPPLPNKPSTSSGSILNLDFQPGEQEAESQRTGAKSSKDSLSSIERRRRYLGRIALGAFALAFGVQVTMMGREWEEHELKAKKMVCSFTFLKSKDALMTAFQANRGCTFNAVGSYYYPIHRYIRCEFANYV